MITRGELAAEVWAEFLAFADGTEPFNANGLPGTIPSGGGKSLVISDKMATDIAAYGRLVHDSSPELKVAYGSEAIAKLIRRAFGETLVTIDTDMPTDLAGAALLQGVERCLTYEFSKERTSQTFVFGCWLIRDDVAAELTFGPVRFERRHLWLDRAHAEGCLSELVYRRIKRRWSGATLRPLKDHVEQWRETGFLNAIGDCPEVCTVATNGLASDVAYDKAVLAARLGMTAVALLWERPSKALQGFSLLLERPPLGQTYVVMGTLGKMGSYTGGGKPVGSTWVQADEWPTVWSDSGWLVAPFTELFTSFLNPATPSARPYVTVRLLHALWWLYEACRAEAPLMAAAKFGACLNSLAGGQSEARILKLVEARLGPRADDSITRDGRTAREVVKMLYGRARSRTLHGNNDWYDRDWRADRDLAEHLIRICFVEILGWLEDHPDASSLDDALIR